MPMILPLFPVLLFAPGADTKDAPEPPAPATTLSDRAGNRMESLRIAATDKDGGMARGCTADFRWCVELVPGDREMDADALTLRVFAPGATGVEVRVPLDFEEVKESDVRAWPVVFRIAGSGDVIAGVDGTTRTMYSGGGGSATWRKLYRIPARGGEGKAVLAVPVEASLLIRACFSEKDMKQRAGACHDEYSFTGTIGMDPTNAADAPVLTYRTTAQSFPGRVRRAADSLAAPPLRKRDLVWTTDPACSYRLRYTMAANGDYRPNRAVPECSDYTVP